MMIKKKTKKKKNLKEETLKFITFPKCIKQTIDANSM